MTRHLTSLFVLSTAFSMVIAAPARGADAMAPRTEAEAALQSQALPLDQRLTLRNDAGRYDVWLFSRLDFDKLSDGLRKAVGARKDLGGNWRLERWTWLEPDRSYVADLTGPGRVWQVRLTRHRAGSLVEIVDVGAIADAPPWAPLYRPMPVLLPHGSVR